MDTSLRLRQTDMHDGYMMRHDWGNGEVKKKGTGPYSVSWRNIKIRELKPGEII
jgi:hypothetical protein